MKKLLSLLALGLVMAVGTAHAADDKAATGKKSKLATCSAAAKGLKGDEYKMKRDECMKADAPAAAAAPATPAPSPACEKSAADKKLAGAAKNAHIKKCMADGK
jgi:hypothetical protein